MNLAMKTVVLQVMLAVPRPCIILCFNIHTTAEYFNRNASLGQLLRHISKFVVVCARSRPKMLTKTYTAVTKEVCQASQPLPFINYAACKGFNVKINLILSYYNYSVQCEFHCFFHTLLAAKYLHLTLIKRG